MMVIGILDRQQAREVIVVVPYQGNRYCAVRKCQTHCETWLKVADSLLLVSSNQTTQTPQVSDLLLFLLPFSLYHSLLSQNTAALVSSFLTLLSHAIRSPLSLV